MEIEGIVKMIIGVVIFMTGYLVRFLDEKVSDYIKNNKSNPKQFDSKYRDKTTGLYKPIKPNRGGGNVARNIEEDVE